jgi:UDP-galactose transporter B1
LLGYIYVSFTRKQSNDLLIFPSRNIMFPMFLVAVTSSLASPFGYASLKHVDYITFILAKSCKLLPVMALHVTLFRRKYPLYKYCVVALVTAGVAVFTLHHPTSSKKKGADGSSAWGLLLLGINLLFDGLTNSTQDYIYKSYRPYTGQQMMCALNIISTTLTSVYLLVSPYIASTPIGAYLGMSATSGGELAYSIDFINRYPSVGWDIFAFAACGALGQVFICKSLLLPKRVLEKLINYVQSTLFRPLDHSFWSPSP